MKLSLKKFSIIELISRRATNITFADWDGSKLETLQKVNIICRLNVKQRTTRKNLGNRDRHVLVPVISVKV